MGIVCGSGFFSKGINSVFFIVFEGIVLLVQLRMYMDGFMLLIIEFMVSLFMKIKCDFYF